MTEQDEHLQTPLYLAGANDNLEPARDLLTSTHNQGQYTSIRQPTDDNKTPFSKAYGRENLKIVNLLIAQPDANIDRDATGGIPKRTACNLAANNAHVNVIPPLQEVLGETCIADATGKTALTLNGFSWWKENSLRRESTSPNFIERDNSTAAQDTDLWSLQV